MKISILFGMFVSLAGAFAAETGPETSHTLFVCHSVKMDDDEAALKALNMVPKSARIGVTFTKTKKKVMFMELTGPVKNSASIPIKGTYNWIMTSTSGPTFFQGESPAGDSIYISSKLAAKPEQFTGRGSLRDLDYIATCMKVKGN